MSFPSDCFGRRGAPILAAALGVCAALYPPAPTWAGPIEALAPETPALEIPADPTTLYEQGRDAWQQGDLSRAATLLRRAFDALPEPTFLFNLGVVLEEAAHYEEALDAYRRYLSIAEDPEGVEQALERIEATRDAFGKGRLTVIADCADAAISVDGANVGWAPVERVLVGAGTHRVRIEAPGEPPLEVLATVDAGDTRELTVNLRPRPPAIPDVVREESLPEEGLTELQAWGVGIGASGGALLLSGIALVVAGQASRDDGYDGAGDRDRALGIGLATAGGVATLAGIIMAAY